MPKQRRRKPSILNRAQYRQLASEHSLQVSVLEYLGLNAKPNVYWFAIPNAGKRGPGLAARMKAEGLRAGAADLCIMMPEGRVLWLEMKTGKGTQSPPQRTFEAVCATLDHPYHLVRTLGEAVTVLHHYCVLKGAFR